MPPGSSRNHSRAVVLVVAPRVVLRAHLRVAERDLPDDDAVARPGDVARDEPGVADEVGVVPARCAAVAVDELLEGRVAVGDVGEREIEVGAQRAVEIGGAAGQRVDLRVGAVRVGDVPVRAPDREVIGQQHVRGVEVAQADDRPGRTPRRCSAGRPVAVAGARDRGRDRRRVVAGRRLLDVAPQVRLDVEDDGRAAGRPLEEQPQVRVPGRPSSTGSRGCERSLAFSSPPRRRVRLQEHVVREDRGHAVVGGVLRRTTSRTGRSVFQVDQPLPVFTPPARYW